MRSQLGLAFVLVGIAVAAAGSVHAQESAPTSIVTVPIRPEDIGSYCIYGNRVYSPGAQLCVDIVRSGSPTQSALICKSPAATGGRATWEASGTIVCVSPAPR